MISIIICSRKSEISSALRQNIAETVGCDYELVVIDNSHRQYSIFQAYNLGVRQAQGEILCFMHDDVMFHSKDWGRVVIGIMEGKSDVGAVGIQGAHVLFDLPAPLPTLTKFATWRLYSDNADCLNWSESGGTLVDGGYWFGNQLFADGQKIVEVANVDGVWMCIRRSLFEKIRFDEDGFAGFHCYDADISMQISATHYKLLVSNEILIEHKGLGILDAAYFEAAEHWCDKWKASLPVVCGVDLTPQQMTVLRHYTIDALDRQKELLEYRRLKSTRSYRLGSAILRPLRVVRSLFQPKK